MDEKKSIGAIERAQLRIITGFETLQKSSVDRAAMSASLSKAFNALMETSRKMQEDERQRQLNYCEGLLKYIETLDVNDALAHVMNEARKYKTKLIQATVAKDGYSRKSYEAIINVTLLPLIKVWEDQKKIQDQLGYSMVSKVNAKVEPLQKTEPLLEQKIVETKTVVVGSRNQIECNASKKEIEDYFSILATAENPLNNEPFMSKENVLRLVRSNFMKFGEVYTQNFYPINLASRQKGLLRYFVYEFYLKYEMNQIGTKLKYVDFLIQNFELFKDDDPKTLNGNMNSSKKPADPILTKSIT